MTEEERKREAADEEIEDLEAPGAAQGDVVGGRVICAKPTNTCAPGNTTGVETYCNLPTCKATHSSCGQATTVILVSEM
jgi:hypothetical protein